MKKAKYRILKVCDHYEVQERFLWWWFTWNDGDLECPWTTEFQSQESAEKAIQSHISSQNPIVVKEVCN